ncbi:hypothetical protein SAMD00019534_115050 [Acytostelium subglobosum LB1]|uniref:hypothetical protein n=1 Tax=Acytostelium subglobosum LB1 TaxID=1410327 RepID=UPI0006448B86|nr:hypothetical protein SAMD00019534_115050 [Acytostelium subglobosum LB1]GAM28329.1 hypothetical protein SAMD00019534_115050 [Acytostelium subglobosum LB1]|eukprot:XP_012748646.1 hypothetical protein SAMD00019534_115050 [Acytostelium subglobosum LB1]
MKSVERTPKTQAYLNLGSPLNAISSSPDGSKLIVAGRDTVKIISLEGDQPKVSINLRAGKTQSLNYTGNDCCWHPANIDNYKFLISTAATNGAVVVWNITREGARSVEKVWTDHTRAVNKLAWHPDQHNYLLTGSQDTTLKLSDIREANPCKITFQPKSEAIRDVQFHAFNPNQFAAAFDNGTVQLWDIRKHNQVVEKITAHQGLVLSIEWHPEEKNLIATGGRDRAIRVWDITNNKQLYNISTISSVSRIKWRPNHRWQIASCSSIVDLQTHIWDVKHPFVPIASFTEHRDVPTGLIWHDASTLITCSKDNYLLINNMPGDAYQPYHHIRTTGIGWNVQNELAVINDKINRDLNNESAVPLSAQYPSFFASFNVPPVPSPPSPARTDKGTMYILSPLGATKSADKICDPSFLFEYFAKNYRFQGMSFKKLCKHNESVALRANQYQTSKIWTLLRLHFNINNNNNNNSANNTNNNNTSSNNNNISIINDSSTGSSKLAIGPSTSSEAATKSSVGKDDHLGIGAEIQDALGGTGIPDSIESSVGSNARAALDFSDVLDDDEDDILSAEAVTPLAPLPTRAPSPAKSPRDMDKQQPQTLQATPLLHQQQQQQQLVQSNGPVDSLYDNNLLGVPVLDKSTLLAVDKKKQKASSLALLDVVDFEVPSIDIQPTILEMLEHCNERGDVQTCVFVMLILKEAIKVDRLRVSQWLGSYIELLHRFRMWNNANEIMKGCDDPSVSFMSQRSTSVLVSCACGKTLPPNTFVCDKCGSVPGECSVCRLPVKGSFVWCQGCGHGGHLEHIKQWFDSNHENCPTGSCTHICRPRLVST